MGQDVKLMPIAKVNGREFLVDIAKREFRNFDDSENIIKMHSPFGRQIVTMMQGSEWNSLGVSTGRQKEPEV